MILRQADLVREGDMVRPPGLRSMEERWHLVSKIERLPLGGDARSLLLTVESTDADCRVLQCFPSDRIEVLA